MLCGETHNTLFIFAGCFLNPPFLEISSIVHRDDVASYHICICADDLGQRLGL